MHNVALEFIETFRVPTLGAPYFESGVQAGFPSPADDWKEVRISFDEEVFGHSPSTKFCVKVIGHSMKNAGIDDGDIVVVDKRLEAFDNDIAVCIINGEFTLKRLKIEKECIWLMPENDKYKPIMVNENEGFEIWGVVINTLKFHRRK
jgi:DNA polymerase V